MMARLSAEPIIGVAGNWSHMTVIKPSGPRSDAGIYGAGIYSRAQRRNLGAQKTGSQAFLFALDGSRGETRPSPLSEDEAYFYDMSAYLWVSRWVPRPGKQGRRCS